MPPPEVQERAALAAGPEREPTPAPPLAAAAARPAEEARLRPLSAMLRAKLRMARHLVASLRSESKLKVSFVSFSAGLLLLGMFSISFGVFRALRRHGSTLLGEENGISITDLVFDRLLGAMALTVLVLLVVSNVLVAYATLYRSREVSFLVSAPVGWASLFLSRFVECVSFSSWALAFLGAPLLLGYGISRGASPLLYLAAVAFFLPFVTIPAAAGSTIALALVRLLAGARRLTVVVAGAGVVAGLFWFFGRRGALPALERANDVSAVLDLLGRTEQPFLPSHWLARGLLHAAAGELGAALFYWLVLCANAALLVLVATLLAERLYYRGLADLAGADEARRPGRARGPLRAIERLLAPIGEPMRSLVAKDLRVFWRDPAQWSQFLLFFGMMALYLANIRGDRGAYAAEPWRSWIALLNTSVLMGILATLTTRFVFPLISLEGRRFWILGLAPLTKRRLLWQKFVLSLGTTALVTLTLAVLSGRRMQLGAYELWLTLFGVAVTTVALSGLAVGLGSIYPNFHEDNPSRITSGMGGTLNFILSLAFILVMTLGQGILLQWHRLEGALGISRPAATLAVAGALLLCGLATALVPMWLGQRNLERTEF